MSKKKHKKNNAAAPAETIDKAAIAAVEPATDEAETAEAEKKAVEEKTDKKTGETFLKAIDKALDEEPEDLGHPEITPVQTAKKISLRKVAMSLFGFFVMVFAVIGIIASVSFTFDYIESRKDDSALKASLLETIAPLTATDSSIFESPEAISEDMLITCACWDIILTPEEHEEDGGIYTVSQIDIDKHITSIFGSGLKYTHKTVGDEELAFIYDEETGMYTIPAYPQSPAYIPKLNSYEKTEGGYRLEVAYYLPITNLINGETGAEKIMIYTVKEVPTGLAVTSLEISEIITGEEL